MVLERTVEDLTARLSASLADQRYPLTGQWELTCRCNLRCVMCYTDCFNTPERVSQELQTHEIIRLLDEIRDAGCVELTLTGGEPLARPDFKTIYSEAHRRGFLLTLFTNGTLISDEIADLWLARPPQRIEVSLHGGTEALYESITARTGSYAHCFEGITRLTTRGLRVHLKTAAMTVNEKNVLAIRRIADDLGPLVSWSVGEYMRDDLLGSGAPFQYQLSSEALSGLAGQVTAWSTARESLAAEKTRCGGGDRTFHIDALGRLQRCSSNRRDSYDLRRGSFREGFFDHLPRFSCRLRTEALPEPLIPLEVLSSVH